MKGQDIGHKTVSTSKSLIVELDQLGVIPQTVVAGESVSAGQQHVPTISNKKVHIDDAFVESLGTIADEDDDANIPMVSQSQVHGADNDDEPLEPSCGTVFQFNDNPLRRHQGALPSSQQMNQTWTT